MSEFFKKRKKEVIPTEKESSVVLCIPTSCESREELFGELTKNNIGNYLYAGLILMNLKTQESFGLEICERDPGMKKSFEVAGKMTGLSEDFLEQIDTHRTVAYLTGKSGSFENSFAIAKAAEAILNSGGLGVKVESSGKAFTSQQWLTSTIEFDEMKLYELFVLETIYDHDNALTYSCGMHNLGFRDVAVRNEEFHSAYELIRMFNIFRFIDKPVLNEGETFRLRADSDRYFLHHMSSPPTEGQDLFENPFGFWELQKADKSL